MKKGVGIYTITNIVNNKMYLGYTSNFQERKFRHFSQLRLNKHKNYHLQSAFNKYGESNFIFEILEECDINDVCWLEYYWMNLLNLLDDKYGYNIGLPNPLGKGTKHCIETREKIKRNTPSPKGRKHSEETIKILKEINKNNGKNRTQAGFESWKKSVQKPVQQFNLELQLIQEFNSSYEAAKSLNKSNGSAIVQCCKNKSKTAYGFIWKYK